MFTRKKLCFFNVGFEALLYIYSLCSQEKSYVFSIWDKKIFSLNTSTLKDNIISFQFGI